MENVIVERMFTPAMTDQTFREMALGMAGCMSIYRAQWLESILSVDGNLLLCHFLVPDSESIRQMTSDDGAAEKVVWNCDIEGTGRPQEPNVVVTRRFDEPTTVAAIQAIEDAGAWCLEQHRVTFIKTYFSTDRKRMICLYHGPDAESVRMAQAQAGLPTESVWACQRYTPMDLSSSN